MCGRIPFSVFFAKFGVFRIPYEVNSISANPWTELRAIVYRIYLLPLIGSNVFAVHQRLTIWSQVHSQEGQTCCCFSTFPFHRHSHLWFHRCPLLPQSRSRTWTCSSPVTKRPRLLRLQPLPRNNWPAAQTRTFLGAEASLDSGIIN